jgi:hypothetical protein
LLKRGSNRGRVGLAFGFVRFCQTEKPYTLAYSGEEFTDRFLVFAKLAFHTEKLRKGTFVTNHNTDRCYRLSSSYTYRRAAVCLTPRSRPCKDGWTDQRIRAGAGVIRIDRERLERSGSPAPRAHEARRHKPGPPGRLSTSGRRGLRREASSPSNSIGESASL